MGIDRERPVLPMRIPRSDFKSVTPKRVSGVLEDQRYGLLAPDREPVPETRADTAPRAELSIRIAHDDTEGQRILNELLDHIIKLEKG